MQVYDVMQIEAEIEALMDANEEIPEEKWSAYLDAQVATDEMVERLIKYIKHLEYTSDSMKAEIDRMKARRFRADGRIESIQKYLTPYVKSRGKFDVGSFSISTRKSTAVNLTDNFIDTQKQTEYVKQEIEYVPDKKKIKEDLQHGVVIEGASLVERDNLQIK